MASSTSTTTTTTTGGGGGGGGGGASSGCSRMMLQNSGSEGDLQNMTTTTTTMDQRKRKRMLSNRESARRSRMRKQKHLDDLMAQTGQLRNETNHILASMNTTTQLYINIEAENAILRAQMAELSQRLQSMNEIIDYVNSCNNGGGGLFETEGQYSQMTMVVDDSFMNPCSHNNYVYMNQPIMASADGFMY